MRQHLRFYVGEGRASLLSVARNLLVHEGGPVLVIMDADTTYPKSAEQTRSMALATLRTVGGSQRFEVFAYIPEHEIVFFEAPAVLKSFCPDDIVKKHLQGGRLSRVAR